jgi:porphobilinogen synthase
MSYPTERPRRLRRTGLLRDAVADTRFTLDQLIQPVFVVEDGNNREEIPSMPGQFRYTVSGAAEYCSTLLELGIHTVLLFGVPAEKDPSGSGAYADSGIVQTAVRTLKSQFGDRLFVITDVCLCEYTDHGHCGILDGEFVDNDRTLPVIARTAVSQAAAGADMVAPSDMMDGRVGAIRSALDSNGYGATAILSYAVKYSSAFYGPFRDAAGSAPAFGDRRAYQMDFRNWREAVREARLDVEEGADMIMVKPGLPYLDIISRVRREVDVPVVSYCVSGEYSMIMAAARNGWLIEEAAVDESTTALFRAGSDLVITYFAESIARRIG